MNVGLSALPVETRLFQYVLAKLRSYLGMTHFTYKLRAHPMVGLSDGRTRQERPTKEKAASNARTQLLDEPVFLLIQRFFAKTRGITLINQRVDGLICNDQQIGWVWRNTA